MKTKFHFILTGLLLIAVGLSAGPASTGINTGFNDVVFVDQDQTIAPMVSIEVILEDQLTFIADGNRFVPGYTLSHPDEVSSGSPGNSISLIKEGARGDPNYLTPYGDFTINNNIIDESPLAINWETQIETLSETNSRRPRDGLSKKGDSYVTGN